VALGGVPMEDLPIAALQTMTDYQFLIDGPISDVSGHVRSLGEIPSTFDEIFAVADIIVTKPGYATIIEAVASRKPVVYVRRYNFADENGLVEYLHCYGRGYELQREDFFSGNWQDALHEVSQLPQSPVKVPSSGAKQVADIMEGYLS